MAHIHTCRQNTDPHKNKKKSLKLLEVEGINLAIVPWTDLETQVGRSRELGIPGQPRTRQNPVSKKEK